MRIALSSPSGVSKYITSILWMTGTLVLSLWLAPVVDPTTLLLGAVVVVAWFRGLGPGLVAAITALVAVEYYFTPPFYSLEPRIQQLPRLLVFATLAVLSAWGSAGRKRAELSLRQARDELDARVRVRTEELTRANEQLRMQYDIARVLAEPGTLENSIQQVLRIIGEATGWEWGALWTVESETSTLRCTAIWHTPELDAELFNANSREMAFPPGRGVPGIVWQSGAPLWVTDVMADTSFVRIPVAATVGLHGAIGFPIVFSAEILGVVEFFSRVVRQPDQQQLDSLAALGHQIGQYVKGKRSAQALEELPGRLIDAQEQERSRIGRELHDHISQTVGVLTIKIDQLRAGVALPAAADSALDELRQNTTEIADDVHRLSHRLHSSTLDYLGLVPALQKLVDEFSEHHNIAISFAHSSVPARVPSEVALCLFRVTEEGLNNIVKHSRARTARVHLNGAPDGVHLTVEDEGTGFDLTSLERQAGLGFVSMQQRLRAVRGTVRVDSAPSRGTTIDVWIPATTLQQTAHSEAPRA